MEQLTFPAMGSRVHVLVHGGPAGMAARARDRIQRLDALWSRFRPDSEISLLNAARGAPVLVSPETFDLVSLACEGKRLSGGLFEPLILPSVVAAGYDRSFEHLADGAHRSPVDPSRGEIALLADLMAVQLPIGAGFDPGGLGKGLAADIVVAELLEAGARGVLVNVGGDLTAGGEPPGCAGWIVEIEHPVDGASIARLSLDEGAIATTSPSRRRWRAGERIHHHLIDARTGRPSDANIIAVTAIASQGWLAEVAAKAAFFGDRDAVQILRDLGTTGVVLRSDGTIETEENFWRFAA